MATGLDFMIFTIAFFPPIVWLMWIRNTEIRNREPWAQVARMFLWGATGGVALALILSQGLFFYLEPWYAHLGYIIPFAALTATVVAPLAEEPAKALGLSFHHDSDPEPEDGLIYGAAVGLGFASTENFLYAYSAFLEGGVGAVLVVGGIRAFASAFLHASASALVGYGFLRTGAPWRRVAFLSLAVLLHGAYNGFLSAGGILSFFIADPLQFALAGFAGALILSVGTFKVIRGQLARLDAAPPS